MRSMNPCVSVLARVIGSLTEGGPQRDQATGRTERRPNRGDHAHFPPPLRAAPSLRVALPHPETCRSPSPTEVPLVGATRPATRPWAHPLDRSPPGWFDGRTRNPNYGTSPGRRLRGMTRQPLSARGRTRLTLGTRDGLALGSRSESGGDQASTFNDERAAPPT